jgi:hypothetical protein
MFVNRSRESEIDVMKGDLPGKGDTLRVSSRAADLLSASEVERAVGAKVGARGETRSGKDLLARALEMKESPAMVKLAVALVHREYSWSRHGRTSPPYTQALNAAADGNFHDYIDSLTEQKGSPTDVNRSGRNALQIAAYKGHTEFVQRVIDAGLSSPNEARVRFNAMFWALQSPPANALPTMKVLFNTGVFDICVWYGPTSEEERWFYMPLEAALTGKTDIVMWVIETVYACVPTQQKDNYICYAILNAASEEHISTVQELVTSFPILYASCRDELYEQDRTYNTLIAWLQDYDQRHGVEPYVFIDEEKQEHQE